MLTFGVLMASTEVAQSEDDLVYKDFLVGVGELLFVLTDRTGLSSCREVDMKGTTIEQAKASGTKIVARSLVPGQQG